MNHGFVITKGTISAERLDKLLREIVRERWGDLVAVTRDGNNWEIKWGTDYSFGLHLWIETHRKIEMRKQLGNLSSWLQTFIQESLAARLKGKCGDEGVPGRRWDGKPEDWRTFRQWWDEMHTHVGDLSPEGQQLMGNLYQRAIANYPKELLCVAESS